MTAYLRRTGKGANDGRDGAMTIRLVLALAAVGMVAGAWSAETTAQEAKNAPQTEEEAPEAPAEFTRVYLDDAANQAAGREVWQEQCRHCQGKLAYPGKAPKLKRRRYKPEWVFNRVTNGFGKMPAWRYVFTREERMAVTAYVIKKFSQ